MDDKNKSQDYKETPFINILTLIIQNLFFGIY